MGAEKIFNLYGIDIFTTTDVYIFLPVDQINKAISSIRPDPGKSQLSVKQQQLPTL